MMPHDDDVEFVEEGIAGFGVGVLRVVRRAADLRAPVLRAPVLRAPDLREVVLRVVAI